MPADWSLARESSLAAALQAVPPWRLFSGGDHPEYGDSVVGGCRDPIGPTTRLLFMHTPE